MAAKPTPKTPRPTACTDLTVVATIRKTFVRANWLPVMLGLCTGGGPPAASYAASHAWLRLPERLAGIALPWSWSSAVGLLALAGALVFSAQTVYEWMLAAYRHRGKALGFVVLSELIMVGAPAELACAAYACLGVLVGVNTVASACNLAREKQLKGRGK